METKYYLWILAGLVVAAAIIVAGYAITSLNDTSSPGISGAGGPAQERVLSGFNVVMWGGGQPFVRMLDPATGESDTVNLVTYLMFEPEHAESGYSDEGGYGMKQPNPLSVENTYRLGLVYEHGLFATPQSNKEALHCYRIAATAGHREAAGAAQRLGGGR